MGHFDRDEFLKYRDETYSITEFEKENDDKTEKRYVITNKNGELVNVSLGRLKYYDDEFKSSKNISQNHWQGSSKS